MHTGRSRSCSTRHRSNCRRLGLSWRVRRPACLCARRAGARKDACATQAEVAAAAHSTDCYNLQYSTEVPGSQSSTASGPSWWAYKSACHCARRVGARAGCISHTGGRWCCSARHRKVVSSADRATTTRQPPSGPGHCGGGRGRDDWVPGASFQRGSTRTTTPSIADCPHVKTSGRAKLPVLTSLSTAVARHSK